MSTVPEIMTRMTAEYEAAHPGVIRESRESGDRPQGYWTPERVELLFERIRKRYPEFSFESTSRLDGWRVWCPGNTAEGWPDGERHTDPYSTVNDSTLLWIDNGELCFRCAHSHCDEGSAHGKKGREQFFDYYDPDYSLRLQALGDTLELEEEDLTALFEERRQERLAEEQEQKEEEQAETLESPAPSEVSDDPISFPEACMYGPLGDAARDMKMELGLAYPTILGTYSVMPPPLLVGRTNNNLYVCLIMPPGGGKDEAQKRSRRITGIDLALVSRTSPSSDRGLMLIIGHKVIRRKGKEPEIIEGPKKKLFMLNELKSVLSKGKMDNSTLHQMLCDLWGEPHYGLSVKEGEETCDCQVSLIGGVPIKNPSDVSAAFGATLAIGLHSRFIFGYTAIPFRYRLKDAWEPTRAGKLLYRARTDIVVTAVAPAAQEMYDEWDDPEDETGRIRENALRIAALTACAAGESEISVACMTAALEFANWQIRLHRALPVQATQNSAAELENRIVTAWRGYAKNKKAAYFSVFARQYKLYEEFGSFMVTRAFESMLKTKFFVYAPLLDDEGNPKRDKDGAVRLSKKVYLNA